MAFQKRDLKQDMRTMKKLSNTNNTKMIRNYQITLKKSKEELVKTWKMLIQYQAYNLNTNQCLLSLNEKL